MSIPLYRNRESVAIGIASKFVECAEVGGLAQAIDNALQVQEADAYRRGLVAVVSFLRDWDKQLAPSAYGRRVSDIVEGKFNLTRRRYPRKVKS